jgi:hypothetical protein
MKRKWAGSLILFVSLVFAIIFLVIENRRTSFLNDVSEPIDFIRAISVDDGGSEYLSFKDSKGKLFHVCLKNTLAGNQHLTLGDRAVSESGLEERRFLRLLERWYSSDPEARAWADRNQLWLESDRKEPQPDPDDLGMHYPKVFAVSVLQRLQLRNP